jgi:hypothetical protein
MKLRAYPLALLTACALLACNVKSAPPRHPVGELTFSGKAKADVVDLIVWDRTRAERLRQIYLRIAALEYEFDLARARAVEAPRSAPGRPSAGAAPAERVNAEELERFLLPPLAESQGTFERYVALVLEARSLLTEREFERLEKVR